MEDNFGGEYDVEVGGTQIERVGRIRIAVRIRDIVVRDRDQTVVASAPKAEVKISGTSLLLGHLRAESLNLVGAELSVRIAPDGQVTVSASSTHTSEPETKPITLPPTVAVASSSTPAPQSQARRHKPSHHSPRPEPGAMV